MMLWFSHSPSRITSLFLGQSYAMNFLPHCSDLLSSSPLLMNCGSPLLLFGGIWIRFFRIFLCSFSQGSLSMPFWWSTILGWRGILDGSVLSWRILVLDWGIQSWGILDGSVLGWRILNWGILNLGILDGSALGWRIQLNPMHLLYRQNYTSIIWTIPKTNSSATGNNTVYCNLPKIGPPSKISPPSTKLLLFLWNAYELGSPGWESLWPSPDIVP